MKYAKFLQFLHLLATQKESSSFAVWRWLRDHMVFAICSRRKRRVFDFWNFRLNFQIITLCPDARQFIRVLNRVPGSPENRPGAGYPETGTRPALEQSISASFWNFSLSMSLMARFARAGAFLNDFLRNFQGSRQVCSPLRFRTISAILRTTAER